MRDSSSLPDDLLHSYFCLSVINQSCYKKYIPQTKILAEELISLLRKQGDIPIPPQEAPLQNKLLPFSAARV